MCGGSQYNLFGMLCAYKGILLLVGEDYVTNKKNGGRRREQRKSMAVCQTGKGSRSKESNQSRRRAGLEQHFEIGKAAMPSFLCWILLLEESEEAGKLPENVKICIREEARKTVRQNYHLLYLEHRIIRTLQEAGVSVVLLKGASTAEFYPVPELRKSGDVDLFLPNSGTAFESGRKDGKPWLCEKSGTFG